MVHFRLPNSVVGDWGRNLVERPHTYRFGHARFADDQLARFRMECFARRSVDLNLRGRPGPRAAHSADEVGAAQPRHDRDHSSGFVSATVGAMLSTMPEPITPATANVDGTPSPLRSPFATAVKLSPGAAEPDAL